MYVPDWIITLDITILAALIGFLFQQLWSKVMNKKSNENSQKICSLHTYQIDNLQREYEELKEEIREEFKEFKTEIFRKLEKLENKIDSMK